MDKIIAYADNQGNVHRTLLDCLYSEYRHTREELATRVALLTHWQSESTHDKLRSLIDELEDLKHQIMSNRGGTL